jgi:hypothetical protein
MNGNEVLILGGGSGGLATAGHFERALVAFIIKGDSGALE